MTIIVIVNPFESHFLALLDFVDTMQMKGYDLLFLGYKKISNYIENYTYKYVQFKTCDTEPNMKNTLTRDAFNNELRELLSSYGNPFVLIPVSRFWLYFDVVYDMKLQFLLYSLCCGADRINSICPPNTSGFFPKKYGRKSILVLALWIRRYIRMELYSYRQWKCSQILAFIDCWFRFKEKLIYGLDGFYLDYPKIVFGPREFNLYNNSSNFFWGLGVAQMRETKSFEYKKIGKKNIYCTFGTMSYRYSKMPALIDLLLYVVSKHSEWNLVLQIQDSNFRIKQNYDNVTVVERINQLDIIKEFDVVIFHGGFGTLKECIYYATPVLVFPCSYDQHGNAARVEYFQIGIRSKALTKSIIDRVTKQKTINLCAEELDEMISKLLYESQYRKNMEALRNKIIDENAKEKEKIINYINGCMQDAK